MFAGEGVCNNWTEALIILCTHAGRACRELAHIAPPDAPDTGHAIVEVWLPDEQRWAMLDSYLGFWARDSGGRVLSAAAFRRTLLGGTSDVELEPIGDREVRLGDIRVYYADPSSWLVEIVRNDPGYLTQHWTRGVERMSKPLGQLLQWALGISPLYLVPDEESHRELRRHMSRFRRKLVLGTAASGLGLVLVLCATLRVRSIR